MIESLRNRAPWHNGSSRPVLITGGAGFVGSNLAGYLLGLGRRVVVLDNLSRPWVERNVLWLEPAHGDRLTLVRGDVRDLALVRSLVHEASEVYHLAAQVAVTTSLDEPIQDFDINARGTLNVLEAIRTSGHRPPLLFTSTNKVYGAMADVSLRESELRYEPHDEQVRDAGIAETRPLEFHSPYGCSKGAADQYVLDYARTYDLPAAVFRMSCIYGPRQFGTEDQGWVAHFMIRSLRRAPLTIYGDGRQVRDILFIDDLVQALVQARVHMDRIGGQAFNIGGGPANSVSLLQLVDRLASLHQTRPEVRFAPWRAADQRYYVSDVSRFAKATGWRPQVGIEPGLERLDRWLREVAPRPQARASPEPPGQRTTRP